MNDYRIRPRRELAVIIILQFLGVMILSIGVASLFYHWLTGDWFGWLIQ